MGGAVAGEVWLVGWLGVRGTAAAAGALNLVAGAIVLWLARRMTPGPGARSAPARAPQLQQRQTAHDRVRRPWLAAACLSGFCLLALEVVWFRVLLLSVLGHATAFALMLAVVLGGIAAGGLLASAWLRRAPEAHRFCGELAALAALLTVACYAALPLALAPLGPVQIERAAGILRVAIPLMFPVSVVSGVLFTALGAGLGRTMTSGIRATGALTVANTVGAALGSLAGGFVLLPLVGAERAIVTIGLVYGATAALLWAKGGRRVPRRAYALAALVLASVAVPSAVSVDARLLEGTVKRYAAQREFATNAPGVLPAVVDRYEGLTETLLYLQVPLANRPLFHTLFMNSVGMADTNYLSRRYMKLYVYWPMAVHPNLKRALLICYGIGNTAKALADSERLEQIDVVDISRDVVRTSHVIYPDQAGRPLADPRVRVHVEDGRYFLQTTSDRFDLITGEPPPPIAAGVVNLYSREYFRLTHERLAEGGIVTYWLPVHALTAQSTRSILRAFCDVFDDCSLWNGIGTQLMMVGTRRGAGRQVSEEEFIAQWRDLRVSAELSRLGLESPGQLGALFIGDRQYLDALTAGSLPLVDDFPKRVEALSSSGHNDLVASLRDVLAARDRFERSPLVARLWPETMRAASVPYFDIQAVVNAIGYGSPPVGLPELYTLLTQSRLRTLPLWMLGSDDDVQQLIDAAPPERAQPELRYHLGLRRIAERDYAAAVDALADAEALPARRTEAFGWRVFALFMAGRRDEAVTLARERDAQNLRERGLDPASGRAADLPPFWRWMTETFGFELRPAGGGAR
jgi:hypothetical protein